MRRLILAVLCLAVLALPTAASAAPRMRIGFYDDPSFRWSPNRVANLDAAQAAGASILHTTVDWRAVAPTKPVGATDPDDPAYHLNDIDEFVRSAQQHGFEVLMTVWGTPKWANGGKGPNVLPTNLGDLTVFTKMLAARYSGKNPGFPAVDRWSVWNEPNLDLFLTPQYSKSGAIVGPANYAKLYKAAYAGIKAGNPRALVAAGETSARGRDRAKKGVSGSVAPATFARLLARTGIAFDAWAHHPYPTSPNLPPTQKVAWPNVTLSQLGRFERSLDGWFHRRNIPIWITEYGHETKPGEPHGIPASKQGPYAVQALKIAQADPRVQMFVWFILKDSPTSSWQSGFFSQSGAQKPGYGPFAALARLIDGTTFTVPAGREPTVTVALPRIAFQSVTGSTVGISYRVLDGTRVVAAAQPVSQLDASGSVTFSVLFSPARHKTYVVELEANDEHGNRERESLALVTG